MTQPIARTIDITETQNGTGDEVEVTINLDFDTSLPGLSAEFGPEVVAALALRAIQQDIEHQVRKLLRGGPKGTYTVQPQDLAGDGWTQFITLGTDPIEAARERRNQQRLQERKERLRKELERLDAEG